MIINLTLNENLNDEILDLLKVISIREKDNFNNLIELCSKTLAENIDWWVEQSSSRNIHQSPLFYRFCCIHLIIELIHSGTNIKKVIVDSAALFKIIKELKEKENLSFEIDGPEGELPSFQFYIRKSIKLFLRMWKLKRIQFRAARKMRNLTPEPFQNGLTLIDQFVFPGFITKERYYNGLWDILSLEQQRKTYFVPTFAYIQDDGFESVYNELMTCEKKFLIKEDYLSLFDLLYSLLHIFRVWFIKVPPQEVVGVEFSPLIREELLSGGGYSSALEGLLNYRFAKRLKEKSFDLSLVIDWWEGQPLDRGWNLGFHTFFPKTLRKGYLGYVPSPMELQLYPSENEVRYGVAPATIATIGKNFSLEMKATANPHFQAETAPAFRFGHLWENGAAKKMDYGNYRILMALSFMVDESVKICEQVIDSGLVDEEELEFMIKPHPTMNMTTLKNRLGEKWNNNFQEVEGSTPNYIRNSDLLITGTSSVGLEAVVMGVPVIIVETMNGLAYDPIPESVPKELWRKCRSPKEISEAIKSFRARSPEEVRKHKKLSDQIKKDYFEPVTKESVSRFLELSN